MWGRVREGGVFCDFAQLTALSTGFGPVGLPHEGGDNRYRRGLLFNKPAGAGLVLGHHRPIVLALAVGDGADQAVAPHVS